MKKNTNTSLHFFSMHDGSLHYGGVHTSRSSFTEKLNQTDEDWSFTLDEHEAREWVDNITTLLASKDDSKSTFSYFVLCDKEIDLVGSFGSSDEAFEKAENYKNDDWSYLAECSELENWLTVLSQILTPNPLLKSVPVERWVRDQIKTITSISDLKPDYFESNSDLEDIKTAISTITRIGENETEWLAISPSADLALWVDNDSLCFSVYFVDALGNTQTDKILLSNSKVLEAA